MANGDGSRSGGSGACGSFVLGWFCYTPIHIFSPLAKELCSLLGLIAAAG